MKAKLSKKVIYAIPVVLAALTVLSFSLPVQASSTDDGIESAARMSHVFTNYLQDDDIVVTLSGNADNAAEITLAGKLANDVNGVQSVQNNMTVK